MSRSTDRKNDESRAFEGRGAHHGELL